MSLISCLVIDDESSNRKLICSLLPQLNRNFFVIDEAESVQEGHLKIMQLSPAVIFLDIRLGDGTGFDLLRKFDKISFEVVFISGFDEYALKAFEFSALDYILKPIEVSRFSETLTKLFHRITNSIDYFDQIMKTLQTYDDRYSMITRIPIHQNDMVILLELEEVMYIMSEHGYTWFFKSVNEKYLSSKQLSDYDFILESLSCYLKISKGCYINVNHIFSYSKGIECSIVMKDGSVHEISRRKKREILQVLNSRKKPSRE